MSKFSKLVILCLALAMFAVPVQAYPGGAAPSGTDGANASAPDPANVGTVVETMNSGGYTYALLENNGQRNWVAMAQTELKVGEQVELKQGTFMKNFSSKSLNRTFERIYFTQGVVRR